MSRTARMVWLLLAWAALMALFIFSCADYARSESPYDVGDTLRYTAVARDSNGVAVLPDAARAFIVRRGVVVDSTKYYPGGGLTQVPSSGSKNYALQGSYVIPAATGTVPVDLSVIVRYTWEGFVDDQAAVVPALVRVNPIVERVELVDLATLVSTVTLADSVATVGSLSVVDSVRVAANVDLVDRVTLADRVTLTDTATEITEVITASVGVIDTLAPAAIEDFYQGRALSTMSCVDTVLAGGIYYQGDPVSNATVWLVNETPWRRRVEARWQGFVTTAAPGYFSAMLYVPALPDTVYLWAHDGVRWLEQGTRIIITTREDCP